MLLFFEIVDGSPSQALTRQLSQRESLWRRDNVSRFANGSPFGRAGIERMRED
jgi:hypothetical protein